MKQKFLTISSKNMRWNWVQKILPIESKSNITKKENLLVPIERRNWIDIEPGKYSFYDYEVSKKVIYLLRHSQQMHREEDGAIHFCRIKENLQNPFPQSVHQSDGRWKTCLAAGGVKRRFQCCTDASGTIVHLRALQGHSGRNLIDPSSQDNVVLQNNFFQHVYHIGCTFNLHSIVSDELPICILSSRMRPILKRSMSSHFPKNLVLQRDRTTCQHAWRDCVR